jgi:hypothetical protein
LVRFQFYKPKTEKITPNRTQIEKNRKKPGQNRAKPSQTKKTKPNRFEPVFVLKTEPNRIETGQFEPVSVRFQFFFDKNRTEPKMITPSLSY